MAPKSSGREALRPSGALGNLLPRSQRDAAATAIQRTWRGGKEHDSVADDSARDTPYKNAAHYKFATHGFSGQAKQRNDRIPGSTETEWSAYESTAGLGPETPALLSSHQRRQGVKDAVSTLYEDGVAPEGAEYEPNGIHTMRANSAWLLGLAHRNAPAVLTTQVDRNTLVRYDLSSTALARELVGMTNSGHFEAGENVGPWQTLTPTATASTARLEDFQTPTSMPLSFVEDTLDQGGVDTSKLNTARK